MRAPVSWLREYVDLPEGLSPRELAAALVRVGLEVETVEVVGEGLSGPLVVGRVEQSEELTEFRKPIRYCQVDVGAAHGGVRGIVCGARNFAVGDLVPVVLPGAVLPGASTSRRFTATAATGAPVLDRSSASKKTSSALVPDTCAVALKLTGVPGKAVPGTAVPVRLRLSLRA